MSTDQVEARRDRQQLLQLDGAQHRVVADLEEVPERGPRTRDQFGQHLVRHMDDIGLHADHRCEHGDVAVDVDRFARDVEHLTGGSHRAGHRDHRLAQVVDVAV